MVTKTVETASEKMTIAKEAGEAPDRRALLLELEGMAVPVRRLAFSALQSALRDYSVKLDEGMFTRYGLHAVPEHLVNDLVAHLDLKSSARSALLGKLTRALLDHFASDAAVLVPGLERVFGWAAGAGMPIGVLSWQPESAARALADKVGLNRWNVRVCAFSSIDHEFPGADVWLKSVKMVGGISRRCVALVGSHTACRAAMAAGVRTVVVPDRFTSFQDFGGADVVVDALADLDSSALSIG